MTLPGAPSARLRPLRGDPAITDPDLALGARLLERVGPVARSEHRKRRVWHALGTGAASRLGVRLRTLHLAFAGLLVAAASSAGVGSYYTTRAAPAVMPAPPAAVAAAPRAKTPALPRKVVLAPEPEQAPPDAAPAPRVVTPALRAKLEGAAPPKAAQAEAEAQLLVQAMRARREGNSKRVSELVDEYRAKHPQGTLQEEALILSIESSASRHAPNTAALAREYLARFPNGRFAPQARRALNLESR